MSISTRQSGWLGGIADDPRAMRSSQGNYYPDGYTITKHFDLTSNVGRLTPYRTLIADTNDGSTSTGMKQYAVQDFVYGSTKGATTNAELYGLGKTGAGFAEVFYKQSATSGNWTVPASSSGNGAVWNGCFFEFQDYLWFLQGTTQLAKWGTLSGSPSITNTVSTLGATITSVANGVIASDANAYFAYNNVIVRIAPGLAVTDNAKTVPSNYKITSLCNYGNYLAIGCSPISIYNGRSKVFIWNLSSDLFQESLEWGSGELRVLENIEGMLVGVSDRYLNNASGAGVGSMIIQTWAGGTPTVVKEIFTQATVGKSIPISKFVKNNRLFFAAKIMTDSTGTTYNEGIWSYGRKNVNYPFLLTLEYIDENISTSGIQAIGSAANYIYIAHSSDGSIDKTNSSSTYTFTSIAETQIYTFGGVDFDKRLNHIKVGFRKLLAGESFTLKYKVDDATAWTTIGTYSTTGGYTRTFLREETGNKDFTAGREFKFRLESTGGLEILSFEVGAQPFATP